MEGSSTFSDLSAGDHVLEGNSRGRVSSHSRCLGDGRTGGGRRINIDIPGEVGFGLFNCD